MDVDIRNLPDATKNSTDYKAISLTLLMHFLHFQDHSISMFLHAGTGIVYIGQGLCLWFVLQQWEDTGAAVAACS